MAQKMIEHIIHHIFLSDKFSGPFWLDIIHLI